MGDYPVESGLFREVKILISPGHEKWEMRKAREECESSDPYDCLVWCLVEVPEEFIKLKVVTDTTQTDDFVLTTIEVTELIKSGGHTEWKEVVCPNEQYSDVLNQVRHRLIDLGFLSENKVNESGAFNNALREYQYANNLPVGLFDLETMDMLGIIR